MTYQEAKQVARTKAAQLTDAQLIEMYEYAQTIKGDLDTKWLIEGAALDNLWERYEDLMDQHARECETNNSYIIAENLKALILNA